VAAGHGHLDRAPREFLAFDVEIVVFVPRAAAERGLHVHAERRDFFFALDEIGGFAQVAHGMHREAFDDGGFLGVFRRHQDALAAFRPRPQRDRQHAAHAAHLAAQRQFARHAVVRQPRAGQLVFRRQHAQRDG